MTSLQLFDAVRVMAGALWLWLAWQTCGGAVRVFRRVQRYYDMLRASDFMAALFTQSFNVSWLFYRDTLRGMTDGEIQTKTALYVFSAAVAFFFLVRLRVYERDCRDC